MSTRSRIQKRSSQIVGKLRQIREDKARIWRAAQLALANEHAQPDSVTQQPNCGKTSSDSRRQGANLASSAVGISQ
jgi:hypothetical protein